MSISDGVMYQNIPDIKRANLAEGSHETQTTLGKMPEDSKDKPQEKYMSEVTVDELYFWEAWLHNVQIWKV